MCVVVAVVGVEVEVRGGCLGREHTRADQRSIEKVG